MRPFLLLMMIFCCLPAMARAQGYVLGAGDVVRITVFGEPDLSGEFKLDGAGVAALPLVGSVALGNLDVRSAEQRVAAAFKEGYLRDPKIAIEVATARPFFIMGEVHRPGSYDYVEGLNVLQAVALAGGFTYRANQRQVELVRGQEYDADVSTIIKPGDVIKVKESFF